MFSKIFLGWLTFSELEAAINVVEPEMEVLATPPPAGATVGPDPRWFQIAILSSLVVYGTLALSFAIAPGVALTFLLGALATQWLFSRYVGLPFDARSPLISALSLVLLLRTPSLAWALLAAVVTISSKFLLRARGKHIFNPTNFGIVVMLLVSPSVWVSPGQWGSLAFAAFLLASAGALVVTRAERADVSWAFLVVYVSLVFGRAIWLGDPLSLPLHRLQSGSLLVFAFFMISDPKTTPDSRSGRLVHATGVALLAFHLQYQQYEPNGLLYALVLAAPLVVVLDWLWSSTRYVWPSWSTSGTERSLVS